MTSQENTPTPEKTAATDLHSTDLDTAAVEGEVVETATGTLDEAVSRAREQILALLQTGQDGVNKSYEFVVDRLENFDLQEVPGYEKLSSIETPKLSTDSLPEAIGGYVSKADELFQARKEQVSEQVNKVLADRKN